MKKIFPFFLWFICGLGMVNAEEVSHYPKVGLALSGGGAKGISHAGVIKAFEESGIPIHCISGVSAGALIAGLYASGWEIHQLETFLKSAEVWDLFAGIQDRRDIPIENRMDALPEQVNIFLDEEGSTLLPMGLISDRQIKQFLQIETLPAQVYSKGNFDSLALPLRVVAADMFEQKAVSFSQGNLAEIMRASMAYPIVFEPIFLDTTLYMDGGFYDNLPINATKEMGADFVIAVNVSDIPPKKEEISDIEDIFSYLNTVLTARSDSEAVSGYDYFIQINNPDITMFEFLKGDILFERGYEAGLKAAQELHAMFEERWDTTALHKKQQTIRTWLDDRAGYKILIQGNKRFSNEQILNLMSYQENSPYSLEMLNKDIDRLYGSGYFSDIDVSANEIPGTDSITFILILKENVNRSIQGGLYFDSNAGMNIYVTEFNRQLFNTSMFLKNYVFIGNYHMGAQTKLSGIQTLEFPFIKFRFTRSFQIAAHRYQYDTNLFDSHTLRKNMFKISLLASASIDWNRLMHVESGIVSGGYQPSQTNIHDYIRRLNTENPYLYLSIFYLEDKRTRITPIDAGYAFEITLNGGRSFLEEFHPVLKMDKYAAYYLKGEAKFTGGKWLNRRFGFFGDVHISHILGYPPLLEFIKPDNPEHLRYFIGKDFLTTDLKGGSLGVVYNIWMDNLWLKPKIFINHRTFRTWQDVKKYDSFFDYGLEIPLIYDTILGPISYGIVFHKEDKFQLNSWARIGFEF
ncbi:MAG: patatin-like phospholipase family protein [Candidatus Marinimicrobia bacterium]|nr:patatin-like phospholipase family protein [Candidatus Neomarinimicrobiota bacterium]